MIVFEPKRINQWQLSRFVPSGIIYGRMGRTMRNYGLRIIARPENKHSPLRRGRKSLPGSSDHGWWACRSSWRSLSWMPKNHPRVRLWNQRHDYWRACPLSQELKLQGEGNFRLDFYKFRREQSNTMIPRIFGGTTWQLSVPFSNSFMQSHGQYRRMDVAACRWRGKHLCFRLWRPLPSDGYEAISGRGTYRPVRGTVADLRPERQYTDPATIAGWCGDDRFRIHLCGEPSRVAFRFRDGLSVCLWYERESGPDGANGLDMTYNRLNLIEKVTRDGRLLANFSYLSNGRKYLKSSDDGHGLCYVGYW